MVLNLHYFIVNRRLLAESYESDCVGKQTVATQESIGCQSGCGNSCVLQIRRPAFVGFALCLRKNTHKL